MTELKGHQDSKEQCGQPLHFTLSKPNIHVSCLLKLSSGPIPRKIHYLLIYSKSKDISLENCFNIIFDLEMI